MKQRFKVEVWRNNKIVAGITDPNIEVAVAMIGPCNWQRSVTIWFE